MPRLRFGETVDARAYSPQDPPTTYTNGSTIECDGTPTEDWFRRQALASIRRPIPQPEREETYAQDRDYRDDYKHYITKEPNTVSQVALTENASDNQAPLQTNEEETSTSTKPPISPDDFPVSLNSIKEYVIEEDGERCIPLHSTIVLKKRRRMLYLPLEFGE